MDEQPHARFVLYLDAADAQADNVAAAVRRACAAAHGARAALTIRDAEDAGEDVLALPLLERLAPRPRRRFVAGLTDETQLTRLLREAT